MSEVVRNVAMAVADGQAALDRRTAEVQRELEAAAAAGDLPYAIDAPWYRFAEVDVDVELAVSVDAEVERDDSGKLRAYKPYLRATPLDAGVKQTYDVDSELASTLSMRLVPVPAARRASGGDGADE